MENENEQNSNAGGGNQNNNTPPVNNGSAFFRGEGDVVIPDNKDNNTGGGDNNQTPPGNNQQTPPAGGDNNNAGGGNNNQAPPNPPAGGTDPWFKQFGFEAEEEAKTQFEKVKNFKPEVAKHEFADDNIRNWDTFAKLTGKKDYKTYEFYSNSVKENPTIDDKIALIVDKMILDSPAMLQRISRDEMVAGYREQLGLDVPDGTELTVRDKMAYAQEATKLDTEYNKVSGEIADINDKIKNNGVSTQDLAQQAQDLDKVKGQWTGIKTEILKDIKFSPKDFTVDASGKRTYLDKSLGDIIFDADLKERFSTYFDFIIEKSGFPKPSDDTVLSAMNQARQWILDEEFSAILKDRDAMVRDNVIKELELAGVNIGALRQKLNNNAMSAGGDGSVAKKFWGRE